jgi:hypothetical protein
MGVKLISDTERGTEAKGVQEWGSGVDSWHAARMEDRKVV